MSIKKLTASEIQNFADRTALPFAEAEEGAQILSDVFVSMENYWASARKVVAIIGDDPNGSKATEYIARMEGMSRHQIEKIISFGRYATFKSYLEAMTGCPLSSEIFE